MRIEIDISGQIQQKNLDSSIGFRRSNGFVRTVFLRKQLKKEISHKYKGQVTNLIEKLHCILIYYCIKDQLKDVKEVRICKDISPRRLAYLLPLLFKEHKSFRDIKVSFIKDKKSNGHAPALKSFRHRKYADKILTMEMVEDVLFKFK